MENDNELIYNSIVLNKALAEENLQISHFDPPGPQG